MYMSHPLAGSRMLRGLSAVIAAVLTAALAGPMLSTASASASCDRSHFPTTCRVDEPTVTQNLTSYPQVQLFARQRVVIDAGGCVQTGGRGLTWKSYVDTAQRNSSYHGLIYIPSVTPGMVRLNSVIGTTVTIPQDTSSSSDTRMTCSATTATGGTTTAPSTSARTSATPGSD